jgi:hypothetical protein
MTRKETFDTAPLKKDYSIRIRKKVMEKVKWYSFVKKWKFLFVFTSALFMSAVFCSADSGVYSAGEELYYEVSFLGVKLGSIKIVSEGTEDYNGKKVNRVKGYIESYKGIPFVSIQSLYDSWMDPSLTYSYKFVGHTKFGDKWDYQQLVFDYNNNFIKNEKWYDNRLSFTQTFNSSKKWNDGLTLFFLARKYLNLGRAIKIPTIIDKDTVNTEIYFKGKKENVSIDAVDYPVRTIYFNGDAKWTGIYGLTGKFEGWFSDDDAHVPIKAKMNVYIGSVNIELKGWKRNNWAPPK